MIYILLLKLFILQIEDTMGCAMVEPVNLSNC